MAPGRNNRTWSSTGSWRWTGQRHQNRRHMANPEVSPSVAVNLAADDEEEDEPCWCLCNTQICTSYILGVMACLLVLGGFCMAIWKMDYAWLMLCVVGVFLILLGTFLYYCGTKPKPKPKGKKVKKEPHLQEQLLPTPAPLRNNYSVSQLSLNMLPPYFQAGPQEPASLDKDTALTQIVHYKGQSFLLLPITTEAPGSPEVNRWGKTSSLSDNSIQNTTNHSETYHMLRQQDINPSVKSEAGTLTDNCYEIVVPPSCDKLVTRSGSQTEAPGVCNSTSSSLQRRVMDQSVQTTVDNEVVVILPSTATIATNNVVSRPTSLVESLPPTHYEENVIYVPDESENVCHTPELSEIYDVSLQSCDSIEHIYDTIPQRAPEPLLLPSALRSGAIVVLDADSEAPPALPSISILPQPSSPSPPILEDSLSFEADETSASLANPQDSLMPATSDSQLDSLDGSCTPPPSYEQVTNNLSTVDPTAAININGIGYGTI